MELDSRVYIPSVLFGLEDFALRKELLLETGCPDKLLGTECPPGMSARNFCISSDLTVAAIVVVGRLPTPGGRPTPMDSGRLDNNPGI